MIEELFLIEKQAYRQSTVHALDARVKIFCAFAAIIAIVAIPYSPVALIIGAVFYLFFLMLWACSRLSPFAYLKRLALTLSFGIFIIVFQIFFRNRYYTEFHTIVSLPFGIPVYAESLEFALILLVKFIVCLSFIILLSSTTKIQDILEGARRLGFPADFTLVIGMMIRYLFVFGYMFRKIMHALETRCFDPFNSSLPYRYRLRMIGLTIGTIFLRSYEQGERTYISMLCRGYGRDTHLFVKKKPLKRGDWAFLAGCLLFVVMVPFIVYYGPRFP